MDIISTEFGDILIRGLRKKDSIDLANIMSMAGVIYGLSSVPYTNEIVVDDLMVDRKKHWLIAEHKGSVIGFLHLTWGSGRWRRVAGLVMAVHDDFTGHGLGFSLVMRALSVGFLYLDLERIELVVYQDNDKAIKIYKKCGFVVEGARERQVIREGVFFDSFLMGITRQRYQEFIKAASLADGADKS